jgi:hypothetical protein
MKPPDAVTASEIASLGSWPEDWRLEHGLKLPSTNGAVMADGRQFHAEFAHASGAAEPSRWPRFLGGALALLALAWSLLR